MFNGGHLSRRFYRKWMKYTAGGSTSFALLLSFLSSFLLAFSSFVHASFVKLLFFSFASHTFPSLNICSPFFHPSFRILLFLFSYPCSRFVSSIFSSSYQLRFFPIRISFFYITSLLANPLSFPAFL